MHARGFGFCGLTTNSDGIDAGAMLNNLSFKATDLGDNLDKIPEVDVVSQAQK